jgi:hypothetical protein
MGVRLRANEPACAEERKRSKKTFAPDSDLMLKTGSGAGKRRAAHESLRHCPLFVILSHLLSISQKKLNFIDPWTPTLDVDRSVRKRPTCPALPLSVPCRTFRR